MFAGLPLIMTQAQGPGHIAFSQDDARRDDLASAAARRGGRRARALFLVATEQRRNTTGSTPASGSTRRTATTPRPTIPSACSWTGSPRRKPRDCLLLHAAGNVFVRELAPGQTILVKPTALIFKDPTVQMQLHFEQPSVQWNAWGSWGNRYMWLRLSGPGRVAIQSVYPPMEGESARITGLSRATQQQW